MSETTYLNIAEVAKRFGVTTSTVYRLAQRRKLPGFKIGGQWRFSERALEHWVLDQTRTPKRNEHG